VGGGKVRCGGGGWINELAGGIGGCFCLQTPSFWGLANPQKPMSQLEGRDDRRV